MAQWHRKLGSSLLRLGRIEREKIPNAVFERVVRDGGEFGFLVGIGGDDELAETFEVDAALFAITVEHFRAPPA